MPRTHGANKSILFAQILNPYEETLREFAQIKDDLFAHVYKALSCTLVSPTQNRGLLVFLFFKLVQTFLLYFSISRV